MASQRTYPKLSGNNHRVFVLDEFVVQTPLFLDAAADAFIEILDDLGQESIATETAFLVGLRTLILNAVTFDFQADEAALSCSVIIDKLAFGLSRHRNAATISDLRRAGVSPSTARAFLARIDQTSIVANYESLFSQFLNEFKVAPATN